MRCWLVVMCLLSIVVGGQAQNNYPPQNLIQTFQREYPKSEHAVWDRSTDSWHVSFKDFDHFDGNETIAYYDKNGKHIETHIRCEMDQLPAKVRDYIQKQYGDLKKSAYTRIDHPGKKPIYIAQFMQNDQTKRIFLTQDGQEKVYHDKHDDVSVSY